MKAAIHLGLTNEKNMEILKYRNFENVENSFIVHENLVMENSTEILHVSKNDYRSSWSSQEVVKGKGTGLLGLSIMSWENDLFKRRGKRKMDPSKWVSSRGTPQLKSFMEPMEKLLNSSENFPRTTLHILWEIQKSLRYQNVESERFSDRIIFMSMFNEQRSRSWSTILDIYSKSD